jgi:antibiotic biosynthesis monooxygenase (ABM) superfamily enzyme
LSAIPFSQSHPFLEGGWNMTASWDFRDNWAHHPIKSIKMEGNHPNEVTFVIIRNIKPGYEKDYDDWLRRYLEIERKAPGYLGTTIIPGGTNSAVRYIIVRYTDKTSMQEWLNSQQSRKLLEEVNNYSTPHYHSATGMETWFTLPDSKTVVAPPRWKWLSLYSLRRTPLARHQGLSLIPS